MNSPGWYVGGTDAEYQAWIDMGTSLIRLSDADLDQVRGDGWVIEGTMGPLEFKRRRLRRLGELGCSRILTAANTATLAAQNQWLGTTGRLVGYDALLVIAHGAVQTLVNASVDDAEGLAEVLGGRRWHAVADQVGLVFSREILPIINEGAAFAAQGLSPEEIDQAMRLGLNYPKGPFAWAALFGWESVFWGLRAMEDMYGPRFKPHPWIRHQIGSSLIEREDGTCVK